MSEEFPGGPKGYGIVAASALSRGCVIVLPPFAERSELTLTAQAKGHRLAPAAYLP